MNILNKHAWFYLNNGIQLPNNLDYAERELGQIQKWFAKRGDRFRVPTR